MPTTREASDNLPTFNESGQGPAVPSDCSDSESPARELFKHSPALRVNAGGGDPTLPGRQDFGGFEACDTSNLTDTPAFNRVWVPVSENRCFLRRGAPDLEAPFCSSSVGSS
jgi:hypothetical protein